MTVKKIDARSVKDWLDKEQAVLIDVREPAEHLSCHIESSVSLPLSQLTSEELPKQTNKKIVIHCQSGKRSQIACEKIIKDHPGMELYNFDGGIKAWQQAGFAAKENKDKVILPIDRQVQLTIGMMLLIGVCLTYFVNTAFLIIPLLLGLGLCFAGISGTCGLLRVLAKMPWNKLTVDDHV